MRRVLLTGVGGFIGANCLKYFIDNTDWFIIGIDSFRHKGTYSRINSICGELDSNRACILQHDLSTPIDSVLENQIMNRTIDSFGEINESKVDYIINLASDSAVERSITNPVQCWRNNCDVILNILEFARKVKPDVFWHTSTDEVFGDCPQNYSHKEWDSIVPSNPYAASKAAQEALAISYWRTFNVPVVMGNIMNCIGIGQDKEKFLPKLISKIMTNQEIEIYIDNENIGTRNYLQVENHADAIKFCIGQPVLHYSDDIDRLSRYNIAGNIELNNLELAQIVANIMCKELKYRLVQSSSIRRGYDKRYSLDDSKLRDLGWKPPVAFADGIQKIIKWTVDNPLGLI